MSQTKEELKQLIAAGELRFPVRFQLVVQGHEGRKYLFELDTELPCVPVVKLGLANMEYIPNVLGPNAPMDNMIVHVIYDEACGKTLCQIGGFVEAAMNREEIQETLHADWRYVRDLTEVSQDPMDPPQPRSPEPEQPQE